MDIGHSQVCEYLIAKDNYVVITHANPDADTVGSALALVLGLRKLGKTAVAVCSDPIPRKLSFLDTSSVFVSSIPKTTQNYISVDTASPDLMGKYQQLFEDGFALSLVLDHHIANSIPTSRRLVLPDYSSCGELIFEILEGLNVSIDIDMASALYAALSSDTGGFRFSNTRPETLRYAATLLEIGIDFAKINRCLFEMKYPPQLALEKIAYNTVELHHNGKLAVLVFTEEDIKKSGALESDLEGITQIPRQIAGVEISAVIRPRGDNSAKVSLRSNEYFNVGEFASEHFGGGGHHHAAGCSFDKDVLEVKDIIIKAFDGLL